MTFRIFFGNPSTTSTQGGFFSFLAFWMGGAGSVGSAPPGSFIPRLTLLGAG